MRSCSIESMPFAMPHFLIRTGTHQGRLPSVVYFDTIQHRHTSIQQTSIFPAYRVAPANLQITIDFVYIYISNNVLYEFHHIQIYKTSIDC